jgi:aminocarboxymuconate-semialdehyde decarboxylase
VGNSSKPLTVDIHSHVFLSEMSDKAGAQGSELVVRPDGSRSIRMSGSTSAVAEKETAGSAQRYSATTEARIEEMDRMGVDIMGVTVPPPLLLYWAEPEQGRKFSAQYNDALAAFCRPNSDRLFFLATVPLQDPSACAAELDRAVQDLGAKGVMLGTNDRAGLDADDEAYWPLYERIQSYDIPLMFHAYAPPDEDKRRRKYLLPWVTDFPYQETTVVARLMLSGVMDEFPNLKICISHGGGMMPFQWGRFEKAIEQAPDVKAKQSPREYLKRIYFDTLVHDLQARQFLVEFSGVDNLVIGSNYGGRDFVDGVRLVEELDLNEVDNRKVMGENAVKLFNLQ